MRLAAVAAALRAPPSEPASAGASLEDASLSIPYSLPLTDRALTSSVPPDQIFHAAEEGNLTVVTQLLADSWPSPETLNEALSRACAAGHLPVAQHLILQGAAIEPAQAPPSEVPFFCACNAGNLRLARELLRRGARIDRAASDGETPLGRAAFRGRAVIVEMLLHHRASLEPSKHSGAFGGVMVYAN